MRVATDIGGTFTDLVAISEDGALVQEKAHTTPPNLRQASWTCWKRAESRPRA